MPVAGGPKITTTGILLEVDAANASSYISGSSTWVNVFRPGTRNGTINGTLGFNQDDSKGALTFPGTASSYVDFGNIGDLSSAWSFQVAVKPAPSASGNYTILSYISGSNTASLTFELDYSSSTQTAVLLTYSSASAASRFVYAISGSVPTGSWSIINGTYSNGLVALFVNSQPVGYSLPTGSAVGYNTNNRLYLGGAFGTTSSFYTGSAASLIAYNTDVPTSQVTQNYNAFATRYGLKPSSLFPIVTDPDAFKFINIADITNQTQITAVNNLVVGLKTNNLWDKMQAIYPFVGGAAYTHKFNLKDPRDIDSAFRILFNGDVTHSNLGVSASLAGYGDTRFVPTASFANISSSIHIAIQISTRPVNINTSFLNFMGDQLPKDYGIPGLTIGYGNGGLKSDAYAHTGGGSSGYSAGGTLDGLHVATRISAANMTAYRVRATGTNSSTGGSTFTKGSADTNTIRLFAPYLNNLSGGVLYQYASIGVGLTSTDVANLFTLLTAFNTTLGRS